MLLRPAPHRILVAAARRGLHAPAGGGGGVFAADAQTDGRYLFTSLRLAQELFSYPDRASAAVVRVARGARPAEVKRRVAEAAGGAFEVRTRDELNASFYTIMQYEKWGIFLISLLVLVIASFSIVGTVVMLVLDKRPEFVALGAMGGRYAVRPPHLLLRRGLIGVLGAGGVVLGVGLCLVQYYFGVIEIPADSFLVKSYPVLLRGATWRPSWRLSRSWWGDDGRDGTARGSCGRYGRRPHGAMTSSCFGRAEAGNDC